MKEEEEEEEEEEEREREEEENRYKKRVKEDSNITAKGSIVLGEKGECVKLRPVQPSSQYNHQNIDARRNPIQALGDK